MKYYKDNNNRIYAYEDDVPEFGSFTEVEIISESGNTDTKKVYHKLTVKEGLIAITKDEVNDILNSEKSANEADTAVAISQDVINCS